MRRLLLAAFVTAIPVMAVRADDGQPIRIVLHPKGPPSPVLRYPLLPELRHRKSGNTAPLYREADKKLAPFTRDLGDGYHERLDQWRLAPLKELPREQMHAWFTKIGPVLHDVETAARCETCDWELTAALCEKGVGVRLDGVQALRGFTAEFGVRARLALAEGRIEDALRDVQTMFAMARHANSGPTLICALVAAALTNSACDVLQEVIQEPNAPNLYWSLTDLPAPFIDLKSAFQGERLAGYGAFPGMGRFARDRTSAPLTPDECTKLTADLLLGSTTTRVSLGKEILRKHEAAKRVLIGDGWQAASLEKMPHLQVAMLRVFVDYESVLDEMRKLTSLPFWQAAPALEELYKRLAKAPQSELDAPIVPFGLQLFRPHASVIEARTRCERRLAVLRCIEAIRLYAAAHGGRLPTKLADIQEVPVPLDPFTGQFLEYRVMGERATLSSSGRPVFGVRDSPRDRVAYDLAVK